MADEKLIKSIKSGDPKALDLLIEKYYGDIYSYCYRRLGQAYNAQDITQEVFLHFCRNFDSYTRKGKCKNYLYVIAHNTCINAVKKRIPIPREEVANEVVSGDEDAIHCFEMRDVVEKALSELPDEQREAVVLRYFHDLKLKEIAKIMDAGLSVTKYRLSQGLKTLKKLLPKEDLS